ncbi:MAG TPA: hypothetical protein VGH62_17055 [Bradyrhizobium sp.]|jgi:hypothetical protein
MSADIIRSIARPSRDHQPRECPATALRAVPQSGKSAPEDADTAPCEYAPPAYGES